VSFLKVDRSFVQGLGRNAEDSAIVEAVVRLGQTLGLTTVAEGVETAEQLAAFRELGCLWPQTCSTMLGLMTMFTVLPQSDHWSRLLSLSTRCRAYSIR
jgi:hypothetical protein